MGDRVYKINEPVLVIFQSLGGETGITDLQIIVTDPQGNDSSPVVMTENSGAIYEAEFTPDELGRWWVKVISYNSPDNSQKESYFIGNQEGTTSVILTDVEGDIADITGDGRLKVSQEISTPPNSTEVKEGAEEVTITKQGGTNTTNWIIPTGEPITLQKFTAGGYIPKDGTYDVQAKFRLVYQPNGTSVDEEVIDILYFNDSSDGFRDLSFITDIGDGTARIQLEITNWSVEDLEATSFFRGYY